MNTRLARPERKAKTPRLAVRSQRGFQLRRPSSRTIELVPSLLKLRSILVPVDFSGPSMAGLRYAVKFARQFGAKINVISVIEPVVYPDFACFPLAADESSIVKRTQAKMMAWCARHGIGQNEIEKPMIRIGSPFQEICAEAARVGTDLIIIPTHGYTGLKRVWMGSTAERVVRHAPCPVLVVRESRRKLRTASK